jgi:peptide/nickel transport system permease protein
LSTSINSRDYPVIHGVAVLISTVVIVVNVLLDITYAYVDPRICYDN